MGQTERWIRHIQGVEELSHQVAAENLIFADWAVLEALGGAFCERTGPSSRVGENPDHSTLFWYHGRQIIQKISSRDGSFVAIGKGGLAEWEGQGIGG